MLFNDDNDNDYDDNDDNDDNDDDDDDDDDEEDEERSPGLTARCQSASASITTGKPRSFVIMLLS